MSARSAINRLRPTSGFAHFLHLSLLVVLPMAVFVLVRLGFGQLALLAIILSKWRMFAVRPRFWAANIRSNSVDLMVGLAAVVFMLHVGGQQWLQLTWAALYAIWLVLVKPASGTAGVTSQAFVGQLAGLSALYLVWVNGPSVGLTLMTGLICFLAARHFFDIFDEPYGKLLAYIWGYFGAALGWLTSHWLLFYHHVAQPTLLLSAIGYGLAGLYYLDHQERLGKGLRRQLILVMAAAVLVILIFSDWGDKVV